MEMQDKLDAPGLALRLDGPSGFVTLQGKSSTFIRLTRWRGHGCNQGSAACGVGLICRLFHNWTASSSSDFTGKRVCPPGPRGLAWKPTRSTTRHGRPSLDFIEEPTVFGMLADILDELRLAECSRVRFVSLMTVWNTWPIGQANRGGDNSLCSNVSGLQDKGGSWGLLKILLGLHNGPSRGLTCTRTRCKQKRMQRTRKAACRSAPGADSARHGCVVSRL